MKIILKLEKFYQINFFFWFNTHGSNLASKAIFILPTLTFFESENSYINIDGLLKKTQKILPNLKDSQSCFDILKFLFNNKIKIELKSQDFLKNYTYKNNKLKFKSNFKNINKSTYIFFNPNKNILENFYGDCVMTKNSITLSKRAQELKKSTNYNFLTLY